MYIYIYVNNTHKIPLKKLMSYKSHARAVLFAHTHIIPSHHAYSNFSATSPAKIYKIVM